MRSRRNLVAVLISAPLLLAACGEGDAERDDLVTSLTQVSELSDNEANCVADVFYNAEGEAGAAFSQEELNVAAKLPEEIDGFQEAFDAAVADCVE